MHSCRNLIRYPFFILLVGIACVGCDTSDPDNPINDNDWIVMGDQEGMIYQVFDPPLEVPEYPRSGLMIYPDSLSDQYLQLSIYTSGPTGCRNYKEEAMIGGSDSISFLYHYEEHMQYYSVQWAEYTYTWGGVEIDSVYEHFRSFDKTDSLEGLSGKTVIRAFHLADSSYIRNDTTFMFFTTNFYHYAFNQELYNPSGVYLVFKLTEGDRERLGWMKIATTGHGTTLYECAMQR